MKFLAAFLFAFLIAVPGAGAQTTLEANLETDVEVRGQSEGNQNEEQQADDSTTATDDDGTADQGSGDRPTLNANVNAGAAVRGNVNAEEHRSAVASFVQSLRATADRDTGIGAEVSAVAQSQEASGTATADAMARIEKRSGVMSFLFGTDWKSIGSLRSEIAKAKSDRGRLEATLDNTTDASVRADLEAAIDALDTRQNEIASFVAEHESKFSLFGWFFRLFARAEA